MKLFAEYVRVSGFAPLNFISGGSHQGRRRQPSCRIAPSATPRPARTYSCWASTQHSDAPRQAPTSETLAGLFEGRGVPGYIRTDQGPEFIAKTVRLWINNTLNPDVVLGNRKLVPAADATPQDDTPR